MRPGRPSAPTRSSPESRGKLVASALSSSHERAQRCGSREEPVGLGRPIPKWRNGHPHPQYKLIVWIPCRFLNMQEIQLLLLLARVWQVYGLFPASEKNSGILHEF